MPCHDAYNPDRNGGGVYEIENPINVKMKKRLDKVTHLLCSTLKKLEPDKVITLEKSIPGLSTWWEEHQFNDRKREGKKR